MVTYADGTCLDRNAQIKNIGDKIQKILLSLWIAEITDRTPNKEKNAAWWSTNGVPLEG